MREGPPLTVLVDIESERQWTRTNDAKCDPAGRLWVGTMADNDRAGAGSLYRVDQDLERTTVVEGVTISNGLGWSPDQTTMYYIDSPTRRVDVFDYDVAIGEASNRRPFIDTSAVAGLPDGLSVDAEGGIWVAFYGGGTVVRFMPDGQADTVLAGVEVAMNVEGGYFQVVDFFRRIEVDVPRAVLMSALGISEAQDEFPLLSTNWNGQLFTVIPDPVAVTALPAADTATAVPAADVATALPPLDVTTPVEE
jgi:hypothetical protein